MDFLSLVGLGKGLVSYPETGFKNELYSDGKFLSSFTFDLHFKATDSQAVLLEAQA